MKSNIHVQKLDINSIPSLIWGRESCKVFIHVHGKMSRKEFAEDFAIAAERKGYQTLSFDLPEHGERIVDHEYRCDIWNGVKDLNTIADYALGHWKSINLYGSSLGAFFSLHAYKCLPIDRCLFQSPIVDMEYLVKKMMKKFGITEDELREKGEITNPIDPLRWDYYQYVKGNPITGWGAPTSILYGGNDWFQSGEVMKNFALKFGCGLTVVPGSEHGFMGDGSIVEDWYLKEM